MGHLDVGDVVRFKGGGPEAMVLFIGLVGHEPRDGRDEYCVVQLRSGRYVFCQVSDLVEGGE